MKQANFIHKLTKEYIKLDTQNLPKVRALLNKFNRIHLDELNIAERADVEDMIYDLECIIADQEEATEILQESWYGQWK